MIHHLNGLTWTSSVSKVIKIYFLYLIVVGFVLSAVNPQFYNISVDHFSLLTR